MDRVKKAIRCVNCSEILESPVFLPCSHSICENHVRNKASIKCVECGVEHQIPAKTGFPRNQALDEIIAGCGAASCPRNQTLEEAITSNLKSLDFGRPHIEIREHCDKLESLLEKIDALRNDPLVHIYEEIDNLRNRVHIKSEELKLCIDQKSEKILDLLKDYQYKCESLLTGNKKLTEDRLISVDLFRDNVQTKLSSWQNVLKMAMKIDDIRWTKVQRENEKMIVNLEMSFSSLKRAILLNGDEFKSYSYKVDEFEWIIIPEYGFFNY